MRDTTSHPFMHDKSAQLYLIRKLDIGPSILIYPGTLIPGEHSLPRSVSY